MNTLPTEIEIIIYSNVHQMKMKPVLDELIQKATNVCDCCTRKFISFRPHMCNEDLCGHVICPTCIDNEVRFVYQCTVQGFGNDTVYDFDEIAEQTTDNMLCDTCSRMNISEYEESQEIDEEYREYDNTRMSNYASGW